MLGAKPLRSDAELILALTNPEERLARENPIGVRFMRLLPGEAREL